MTNGRGRSSGSRQKNEHPQQKIRSVICGFFCCRAITHSLYATHVPDTYPYIDIGNTAKDDFRIKKIIKKRSLFFLK